MDYGYGAGRRAEGDFFFLLPLNFCVLQSPRAHPVGQPRSSQRLPPFKYLWGVLIPTPAPTP